MTEDEALQEIGRLDDGSELPRARAARTTLALVARLRARTEALDLAEAERLARETAGDRSRLGRALALILAELDRARGTTPPAPVPDRGTA